MRFIRIRQVLIGDMTADTHAHKYKPKVKTIVSQIPSGLD